jgi:WD40 repeat protein/serine/threonine protein kinase
MYDHDAEALFLAALERATTRERDAFLQAACAAHPELLQRVRQLLAAHQESRGPLDAPAVGPGGLLDPNATIGAPAATPPTAAEGPGAHVGPYKLLQQIGEGGMGTVFMAEQTEPVRRKVALKLIRPGMGSDQVVARFEAERQALALMDHPNIARVIDAGTTADGRPYFVMELVKGVPITRFCDDNQLTPRERLELFIPVCQALQHAHQKGVIHRDVKPSNVLVTLYDGKPVPKVIDFGVAKAVNQPLTERTLFTEFGALVGTLEYMSPEQAELNALDVDTRSDVYALGVLLYELLTGTTPLQGKELRKAGFAAMLRMIREVEPERPSNRLSASGPALAAISQQRKTEPAQLTKLVRGELDWIVMKALEKDRGRRYESAGSFAKDVDRYLKDEPVEASPPSAGYRLRKFLRRNKGPTTAAALVVLALVAGLIGTSAGIIEALRAREQAEWSMQLEQHARVDAQKATAAEMLATRKALDAAEANKALAKDADDRRRKAEALAVRLQFEDAFRQRDEQRAFSLLKTAGLLREPVVLEDRPLRDSLRLHLGAWIGRAHRVKGVLAQPGTVEVVALSPDGKAALTGSGKTARLWETATGKPLGGPLPHQGTVYAARFSPDGRVVLTQSFDRTARLWEAATGKPLGPPLQHEGSVVTAAFSPDGKTVLTGGGDWTARLWETATGKSLGPPLRHRDGVLAVAFSPDGKTVLTGSADGAARLWEAATGKQIGPTLQHQGSVQVVAFSPDGKTVLTGSMDHTALLWEVATGKQIGPPLEHRENVNAVAFSPDGKTVLTGGADRAARLWEAATGKQIGPTLLHPSTVVSVAFSPDGQTVLIRTYGTGHRWETATANHLGPPLQHPDGRVAPMTFSPDGQTVLMGSSNAAWLWDMAPASMHRMVPHAQEDVNAVAFSPGGKTLLTGGGDNTARLWEAATGKPLGQPLRHENSVEAVAFSPDGQTVLTGSADGTVRQWEAATGKKIGPPLQHEMMVRAVAFSPDGKTVLTGSADRTARLWEAATGKQIGPLLLHQATVGAVQFSPDGKTVLTRSGGKSAQLWEAATGKPLGPPLRHRGILLCMVFSPDGRTVLTGGGDDGTEVTEGNGEAVLWEAATGKPLGPPLLHQTVVSAVAFSPDGKTVLTGSLDTTARLWEAAGGKPLGQPLQHPGPVYSVAFSPDGATVLTACEDGGTRLWERATGKPLALLRHQPGVLKAAFSPDGKTILTKVGATVRLWPAPRRVEGDPERILLWVQVVTGMELNESGAVQVLDAATWGQRRQRLQELGGPPHQ